MQSVQRIEDRSREATRQIMALQLFDAQETGKFVPRVAVMPRKEFEQIVFGDMEDADAWKWARVGVQSLKSFGDTVVYDASIADTTWDSVNTMLKDEKRELFHENTHPIIHWHMLPSDRSQKREGKVAFQEIVSELVPRVLLGFQKEIPESTNFLLDLPDSQTVTIQTVNEQGYKCFPAHPLAKNPVYGGLFLTGLAVAEELGEGDLTKGTRRLIRLAQQSETADEIWDKLDHIGISRERLLESKEMIKGGKKVLRKLV